MKTRFLNCLLVSSLMLGTALADADSSGSSRTWTDAKGRQLVATFVAMDGTNIILQTVDNVQHKFPLTLLSPEDQQIAKTMKPMEGAFVATNASAAAAASKVDQFVAMGIARENAKKARSGDAAIRPNPLTSDEQFVRRVYLDIAGRMPDYVETTAFLDSTSATKRAELIDKLLDSDGYVSSLYNYFADMLRITDKIDNRYLKGLPYIKWLKDSLATNKSWDNMVFELMTAEGKLWNNGAAGYLLRDAGMPLDNLSNTLSIFLGTDVACAQCHDHPFSNWTQMQFYQMASFFGATTTKLNGKDFGGKDPAKKLVAEMTSLIEMNGMDSKKTKRMIGDVLKANEIVVHDLPENRMKMPHDYKYSDAKPNDPVKPKFVTWSKDDGKLACYKQNLKSTENLRTSFAKWMTDPTNPRFAMTIANRMWARAMGVGFTQSVSNIDDPAESYNPELLKQLGSEMVRLKFNLKEFMRVIYNTQAYQREATTQDVAMGAPYFFQGPMLRRMSAEEVWDSYMTLVLGSALDKIKNTASDPYGRALDMDLQRTTVQTLASKITAIQKLGDLQKKKLASGGLAAAGKMKDDDEEDDDAMDGGKVYQYGGMKLMRAAELEQPAPAGHFLRDFGQSDRLVTDGSAKDGSVPQVLVMMNGTAQQMMTEKDSLMFRTIEMNKTPETKMDAIFLSILNRRPSAHELELVMKDHAKNGDKAFANVIWALINTREFTFIQ